MQTAIDLVAAGECKIDRQLALKKGNLPCRIE